MDADVPSLPAVLPWRGRALGALRFAATLRRDLRFEARALAGLTVMSWLGLGLAPLLGSRPLLLVALTPKFVFLAVAARQSSLGLFVLVGLVRLVVADPLHFTIGRAMGEQLRSRRWHARLAASRHLGWTAVLVRPTGPVMTYAGSVGLPGLMVGVLDVIGTTGYLIAVHAGAAHFAI